MGHNVYICCNIFLVNQVLIHVMAGSRKEQTGQDARFNQLVAEQSERIYNLFLMRCNRKDLAEDMTQETFIRAYRGLARFRGDAQLSTWLYRIALNVCHSTLKRESRHELGMEDDASVESLDKHDQAGSAEADFMRSERKQLLRQAIRSLPDKQADALSLYYLHEMSYQEVAEIMQLPMGTVKSHLHRAKENLREILAEVIL